MRFSLERYVVIALFCCEASDAFNLSPKNSLVSKTRLLSSVSNNNAIRYSPVTNFPKNGLKMSVTTSYLAALGGTAETDGNAETDGTAETEEEIPLFEKFGVGVKRDISRRFPLYGSDIKDGLNSQCLAAIMFLFFACLTPAIGFGGLFGTATNGAIGTMEMVSSTALCGFIYALTSAQPLTIIGSTGPVLAFVATLAVLAKKMSLPFLPLYTWTGLWTSGILMFMSLFSGSNTVKYLTRFTDEIFSVLISVIFVFEAGSNIGSSFSSPVSTFAKSMLSLLCAMITYGTATSLRKMRSTTYFNKSIRNNFSNFAPTIGVILAALAARWARLAHGPLATLPSLAIPPTFTTTSGRPWLVPLFQLPVWARWAAFLPALMATVLLFLDQNITVRVVNNPRYKMTKGRTKGNMLDGMHADLFVVSLLTAFQSIVGMPWLVAATVRSISHVRALSNFDAKGEIKGTTEQRVTGTVIHALIGCCVLFTKPRALLAQIPRPVLMGLFMFLGTSALPGNEMWERMKGLFKDSTDAEMQKFKTVPKRIRNGFTIVQILCLVAMFGVKESRFGVLFPVVIAMLAPIRFGMEKFGFVKKEYMDVLDKDE